VENTPLGGGVALALLVDCSDTGGISVAVNGAGELPDGIELEVAIAAATGSAFRMLFSVLGAGVSAVS